MKRLIPLIGLIVLCWSLVIATHPVAAEKIRLAYISDSPGSSAPYWIARLVCLFLPTCEALKKHRKCAKSTRL